MADVKVVLTPDPIFMQGSGSDPTSYDAASDRKFMQDVMSPGVRDADDFLITLTSGMGAEAATGVAYILGQNVADQGLYRQYRSAVTAITAPAAHATLPRLDQVILRVMDYTHDNNAGGLYEGRLEWIEGTATSGATLDNRNGAANLTTLAENSKNVLLLADYLMAAATSSLSGANLRDKRVRSAIGAGLAVGGARIPGELLCWPSATAPDPVKYGVWLLCDGTSYLRADYPDLFANIGGASSPWGLPDSTHFNVPDGRGRNFVGRNSSIALIDTVGDTDGAAIGVRGPVHRHTVTDPTHDHGESGANQGFYAGGGFGSGSSGHTVGAIDSAPAATGITVGPAGTPLDAGAFFVGNWYIKA
jgi:Phage Tail Collar Domain